MIKIIFFALLQSKAFLSMLRESGAVRVFVNFHLALGMSRSELTFLSFQFKQQECI
jgi:hypothetical protein